MKPDLRLLEPIKTLAKAFGPGRLPGVRYGARAIDLDILLFGDVIMDTPDLSVPHPRLAERAFVLAPLAEIAPGLLVPGRGHTVAELLAALGDVSTQAWSKGALATRPIFNPDSNGLGPCRATRSRPEFLSFGL